MEIIHINDPVDASKIESVGKAIEEGKDVYILVYMKGCGACEVLHPEWNKIKEELESQKEEGILNSNKVVVVDMNKDFLDHASNTFIPEESIIGFPTLLFFGKRNGEKVKEEMNLSLPDVKKLTEWIRKKSSQSGGRRKTRKTRKSRKTKKKQKWSLKYKKSINCGRPRGFSQKQHCKYGRKSWKK